MKDLHETSSDNIITAQKIFDEHGDFIHEMIHSIIKKEVDAEDLFQDLFLFLVAKPIPQNINVRGFLYRIISDEIKDSSRRLTRYHKRMRYFRKYTTLNSPEYVPALEAEQNKKMFELIRESLPLGEASALTLKYRDGYNTASISKKMGSSQENISRYISKGLKKIHRIFLVAHSGYVVAPETLEKTDKQKTGKVENLVLSISVGEFSPEDEVVRGIANLYQALNAHYIASGGSGLVIDEWQSLVPDGITPGVVM